jgi:divalent metal cation (Fe/Co/Zn/Cd) transporter
MNSQRIVGIVMLIVGVAVLIVGVNASHSTADQLSNTFNGRYTDHTVWYMIGGGAAALFGLLVVLSGGIGGRHA